MTCGYKGNLACVRDVRVSQRYCSFHTPKESAGRLIDEEILNQLKELVDSGDGNWEGFIFPRGLDFQDLLGGANVCTIPINAERAFFDGLTISNITFENQVNLQNSVFEGKTNFLGAKFLDSLSIYQSRFQAEATFSSLRIAKAFNANTCVFKSHFFLSGGIKGEANFTQSTFEDRANFWGQRNIFLTPGPAIMRFGTSASLTSGDQTHKVIKRLSDIKQTVFTVWKNQMMGIKKARDKLNKITFNYLRRKMPLQDNSVEILNLFEGKAVFDGVSFEKPSKVAFKSVDMRQIRLSRTELKNVKFIGCNWYQAKLKRNGLYEELSLQDMNYTDFHRELPNLESAYRSIRLSFEEDKDFLRASDFYVGEMNAKRRQLGVFGRKFFSINAIYRIISNYGTSPIRLVFWLVFITFSHSVLSFEKVNGISFVTTYKLLILGGFCKIMEFFGLQMSSFIYSLQVLTLQRNFVSKTVLFSNLDVVLAILGPIFLSLLVIALRGKIKRY